MFRVIFSIQILERSGIGKREILEKAGVEVKVELPGVGANIQEHLYHGVVFGEIGIETPRRWLTSKPELKKDTVDGQEIMTLDSLMNPDTAGKHMSLL